MQCTARNRKQQPCGNDAMKGSNVCRMHGGSAPQVKAAARRRLLEAVDPLMAELLRIALDQSKPIQVECSHCGETSTFNVGFDERTQLTAIRDALDRAGLAAVKQVEVVTLDAIDAEIRRLEAELGELDEADVDL